jgi:hypothetical protein
MAVHWQPGKVGHGQPGKVGAMSSGLTAVYLEPDGTACAHPLHGPCISARAARAAATRSWIVHAPYTANPCFQPTYLDEVMYCYGGPIVIFCEMESTRAIRPFHMKRVRGQLFPSTDIFNW